MYSEGECTEADKCVCCGKLLTDEEAERCEECDWNYKFENQDFYEGESS